MEATPPPVEVTKTTPSFLLNRTPLEIRLHIYKEVIDYCNLPSRVHIAFERGPEDGFGPNSAPLYQHQQPPRKLTYISCVAHNLSTGPPRERVGLAMSGIPKDHWHCWNSRNQGRIPSLRSTYWSLLLTCHQMYSEVIDLVYSSFAHNGFDLVDLPTAHRFFQLVPQQRLNQISSLRISAALVPRRYLSIAGNTVLDQFHEEKAAQWLEICEGLRRMRSLCDLRIVFFYHTLPLLVVLDQELLAPLWEDVKVKDSFVVELPWAYEAHQQEDIAPYKVKRRAIEIMDHPFDLPDRTYDVRQTRKIRAKKMIEEAWQVLIWPFVAISRRVASLEG